MAFASIIPPLKDVMKVQNSLQILDETPPAIKRLNSFSKQLPGISPSNSPEHNLPNNLINLNNLPKRPTSAQSITSSFSRQQQKYQRCIEYLQSQHEQTLTKLHQEVQHLKSENKRLNFKILVESNDPDGGVQSIVKNTLGPKSNKSYSQELLLQETIKDLQVKLNLSQDTNQHQEKTIKNLNKQMKLLKNGLLEAKEVTVKKSVPRTPRIKPSPPPLKNEHIEKDRLILALKDQNKSLMDKLEEQQIIIKNLKLSNSRRVSNSTVVAENPPMQQISPVQSDSRILFNPSTSLPPINRSQQNSRSGRILTPRTSRTDISRRTKRKESN